MTPDLNHSISIHHQIMTMWWRLPEYKKARVAFVQRNPVCIRCGRPTTTPGHDHEDYKDYKTYLAAVVTDKCDPLCNSCNLNERSGRKPCPICVAERKDRIRYIPQGDDRCYSCTPMNERKKRRVRYKSFPCGWHHSSQGCLSPLHYGSVCDRGPRNCTGCDHFMTRAKA
jgi:hypothetical protein